MHKHLNQQIGWFFSLLLILIGCIWASWLAQASFSYGFECWYKFYDIEAHIDEYGPKNRYRHGLETLDPKEHIQLFGQISEAVHNHGSGLAEIQYDYKDLTYSLLRPPEVQHLQDVANLIDVVRPAGLVSLAVGLVIGMALLYQGSRPQARSQLFVGMVLSLVITAIFMFVGAKEIFYQLHVWIFPEDHRWFFYYQESLMATLMKAPILFAGISASIATGGLLLFASLILLASYLPRRLGSS